MAIFKGDEDGNDPGAPAKGTLTVPLLPLRDIVVFPHMVVPLFVGREKSVRALEELDEGSLVRILTEPKNALTKQYQKMLELEGVSLRFTDEALRAVADEALERKAGARGLRSILERTMLDIMYDLPSRDDVLEVAIGEEVILHKAEPMIVYDQAESA